MRGNRTEKLDLRLTAEAKRLLVGAAAAQRRSLSDFVLESALGRAEETLADRRVFRLDDSSWEAFLAALDAEPAELSRMERLLRSSGPFSRDPAS